MQTENKQQQEKPKQPDRVDRRQQFYLFVSQTEAGITPSEVRQAVTEYLKRRKINTSVFGLIKDLNQ